MAANLNKMFWPILLCMILYLIDPFSYGFVFGYALLLLLIFHSNFIKTALDKNCFVLFSFSTVYSIFYSFDPEHGKQFIFIYLFFPTVFYLIGKYFVLSLGAERIFSIWIFLGVMFSLTTIISVMSNIIEGGFVQLKRDVPNIWDQSIVPATNMASYLTFNMCIPALLATTIKRKSLLKNLFLILIFALSLTCILRLGSRTHLGISIITLLAALIVIVSNQSARRNLVLFGFLFMITNVVMNYVSIDEDSDILTSYADRMNSKKYGAATAGGRTDRWAKSIENLFEKPLGWKIEEFGYSHNMWFDVSRVGGIICFFILLYFTFTSFRQLIRIFRTIKEDTPMKVFFIVYPLAFFLLFFVEPIMDGYFFFFVQFCLFIGITNQYYRQMSLSI